MLSSSFAERATSLVTGEPCGDVSLSERGSEGMAKAAQVGKTGATVASHRLSHRSLFAHKAT